MNASSRSVLQRLSVVRKDREVRMGHRIAIRMGVVVIFTLLWIVPLEALARGWVDRFGDPLDRSMVLLRLDRQLGWRQKADFSGTFMSVPVRTNELGLRSPPMEVARQAADRIVILGPSSTFGWGVTEEATYARRLEWLLTERMPARSR